MPEPAIASEMTLFDITEKFPETIDVFVANGYEHVGDEKKRTTNGYEHVGDEKKRTTNGKMVTLGQT